MNLVCWIGWKKNIQNEKLVNIQTKNSQKIQGKIFFFFLIEAEFTTQAEYNSQNMPKCLVFLAR